MEEPVITSSGVPDEGGWTPIPHATARDPRIDRRALGLLVEILSYPPGWNLTMEALGETGREGRDANRSSFGKLLAAGYIVEHRYRECGRWKTVAFAGSTPARARHLADEWLDEHPDLVVTEKPRSRPKTDSPASVEPASVTPASYKKNRKEEGEEDHAVAWDDDQSSSPHQKPAAVAGVAPAAPTPAAGNFPTGISIPAQRKPRTPNKRQQRDDDWVAQIFAAPPDLLEIAIDSYRDTRDGLYEWALREAAGELGLDPTLEYDPDVEAQLLRGIYLFLLKKHAADGDPAGDELMWPLDESIQAAPRPYEWVEHCPPPDGQSAEEFVAAMCQAVAKMSAAERGLQIAEIRKLKPGVWRECRDKAKSYLRSRKVPVESEAMNNYAIQYAILHYQKKGEWPMAMVPRSMRPAMATSEPPPWAA